MKLIDSATALARAIFWSVVDVGQIVPDVASSILHGLHTLDMYVFLMAFIPEVIWYWYALETVRMTPHLLHHDDIMGYLPLFMG